MGKTKVDVNEKGVYYVFELDKKNNQISKKYITVFDYH